MRRGIASLGSVALLLSLSLASMTALSTSRAHVSADALAASPMLATPSGGAPCLRCLACSYTDANGEQKQGHSTEVMTVSEPNTSGKGGQDHSDCHTQNATDTGCYAPLHPQIDNCPITQQGIANGRLSPVRAQQFLALANQLYYGSSKAFNDLRMAFPEYIQVDSSSGMVYLKGCREGVFSGVLPIPDPSA